MTFFVTFVRKLTLPKVEVLPLSSSQQLQQNESCVLIDELTDMHTEYLNPLLFLHKPTKFADKTRGEKRSGCCVPKHYNYMSPPGAHFYSLYELIDFFQLFQRHNKKSISMCFVGIKNQESQRCCKQYLLSRIPLMQERSFLFKHSDELIDKTQFCDFVYFEISETSNPMDLLVTLFRILKCKGNCVITFFSFETVMEMEIVYILTSLFESVHLSKPNASAPFTKERFVLGTNFLMNKCKVEKSGFFHAKANAAAYTCSFLDIAAMPPLPACAQEQSLAVGNSSNESSAILSELSRSQKECARLLDKGDHKILSLRNAQPLPLIFMNKVRQFHVMIAQMEQDIQFTLLNYLSHQQKNSLISWEECIERNSITKCIEWCHRHKIQVNPFLEVSTSTTSSGFPYSSKQGLHFG
jgi:hypothetical protein